MTDRWGVLSKYRLQWPELTPALLASALRWLMLVVAIAGVMWWVRVVRRGRAQKSAPQAGN
jgi:hypothetical protein